MKLVEQIKQLIAEVEGTDLQESITLVCPNCGAEFEIDPDEFEEAKDYKCEKCGTKLKKKTEKCKSKKESKNEAESVVVTFQNPEFYININGEEQLLGVNKEEAIFKLKELLPEGVDVEKLVFLAMEQGQVEVNIEPSNTKTKQESSDNIDPKILNQAQEIVNKLITNFGVKGDVKPEELGKMIKELGIKFKSVKLAKAVLLLYNMAYLDKKKEFDNLFKETEK